MKKIVVLSGLVFALSFALRAADLNSSFYSDGNRELFISTRSAGLAGSDLAFATDGTPHSPAANLYKKRSFESLLSYAGFYGNAYNVSMFSQVAPLGDIGVAAVSLSYLQIPDIEFTSSDTSSGSVVNFQNQTATQTRFSASFGHLFTLSKNLDLGVGASIHASRKNLIGPIGYSLGSDLSVAGDFKKPGISVALSLENVTSNVTFWDSDYTASARHLRLGVGFERYVPYIYGKIALSYTSLDLFSNEGINYSSYQKSSDTTDATIRFIRPIKEPVAFLVHGAWGAEYTIAEVVEIRVGTSARVPFAFGAGVNILNNRIGIDIAYLLHELSGSYQAGLRFKL